MPDSDENPQVLAANGKTPRDPDKPPGVASEDGGTETINALGHVEHAGIVPAARRPG